MTASSDAVHVAMMNLLWPRAGLAVPTFHDYWSGAHTQISSRLPGIHQYFQHHLDPLAGRVFPGAVRFAVRTPKAPGFFGDAEITFAGPAELEAFASSLAPLMEDEQNVFDKTISYQAPGRHVTTWVDRSVDDSPNGDLGGAEKFMLYLRRSEKLSLEEFRSGIEDVVGPALAESEHVLKVRARLVEPYDNDKVTLLAPNVSNREEPADQVQGCLEVMFESPLARRAFGESTASEVVTDELLGLTRDVFPMRALRTFTVYNHGRITTAGLRTPQMAAQIAAIGAVNQLGREVEALILGPHPQRGARPADD